MTNPYFSVYRPVTHDAPEVGEAFEYNDVVEALTSPSRHGYCTILDCRRRFALIELRKHMQTHKLTVGHIAKEMMPPEAKAV